MQICFKRLQSVKVSAGSSCRVVFSGLHLHCQNFAQLFSTVQSLSKLCPALFHCGTIVNFAQLCNLCSHNADTDATHAGMQSGTLCSCSISTTAAVTTVVAFQSAHYVGHHMQL